MFTEIESVSSGIFKAMVLKSTEIGNLERIDAAVCPWALISAFVVTFFSR